MFAEETKKMAKKETKRPKPLEVTKPLEMVPKKPKPLESKPLNMVPKKSENVIEFGKFKGSKYEDLLKDDMVKYVNFIKRSRIRNDNMDDFVKWYDNNKKPQ